MKYLKNKTEGMIFFIPLFLPDWTFREKADLINYGSYVFPDSGIYAFDRLIEIDKSGGALIEIFKYIGSIPSDFSSIITSGRLFNPVRSSLGFRMKRYRFIFADEKYNKIRDSAYDKITFLLASDIWVGGETKFVGEKKIRELSKEHEAWIVYSPSQLENKIRAAISTFFDFNYEKSVAAVWDSLPKAKEKDAKLKRQIAPFQDLEIAQENRKC